MNKFDIIGGLRTFCNSKNIKFGAGDNFYKNADLSNFNGIAKDQLVMLVDFKSDLVFSSSGSVVQSITYDGVILLGRKFESEILDNQQSQVNEFEAATEASLDETFIQKYDRRLLDLMTLLAGLVGEFVCANELQILRMSMQNDINKFDENLDFIAATIQIKQ